MSVTVRIPTPLRRMTNGEGKVEVTGSSMIALSKPLSSASLIARDEFGYRHEALASVGAISADGRTIVGNGTRGFGSSDPWIVRIPEPRTATLVCLGILISLLRRTPGRRRAPCRAAVAGSRSRVQ